MVTSSYSASLVALWFVLEAPVLGFAQSHPEGTHPEAIPLDPTLDISAPMLESSVHTPLPEQYIWSALPGSTGEGVYNCLRKSFSLKKAPPVATLYAAG